MSNWYNLSVQGTDIPLTEYLATGKALRLDFTYGGLTGFQIITPAHGWMMQPGQNKIDTIKGELLKIAQKQLDEKSSQLIDYKTFGSKIEYAGKDTVNTIPCYKLKLTDKEGNNATSYFDMKTYYLLRTESIIKQNDQEQEVAITYKDYKLLTDGIVMPMSVTTPMGEVVFTAIEINKPIDEQIFIPAMPTPGK